MKELSVVEMNTVSGAGWCDDWYSHWGPYAGMGVGALTGFLTVLMTNKLTNETSANRTQAQGQTNVGIIAASILIGGLSGAIAEARA